MPIELSELLHLARGYKPALQVGDLPRGIAVFLKCHPAIVFLGTKEVHKIVRKHPEIKLDELQCLHIAIKEGEYYFDKSRSNCVTIFYTPRDKRDIYLIALKATQGGYEVWVQTFHRISPSKAEKKKKGCKKLTKR